MNSWAGKSELELSGGTYFLPSYLWIALDKSYEPGLRQAVRVLMARARAWSGKPVVIEEGRLGGLPSGARGQLFAYL